MDDELRILSESEQKRFWHDVFGIPCEKPLTPTDETVLNDEHR